MSQGCDSNNSSQPKGYDSNPRARPHPCACGLFQYPKGTIRTRGRLAGPPRARPPFNTPRVRFEPGIAIALQFRVLAFNTPRVRFELSIHTSPFCKGFPFNTPRVRFERRLNADRYSSPTNFQYPKGTIRTVGMDARPRPGARLSIPQGYDSNLCHFMVGSVSVQLSIPQGYDSNAFVRTSTLFTTLSFQYPKGTIRTGSARPPQTLLCRFNTPRVRFELVERVVAGRPLHLSFNTPRVRFERDCLLSSPRMHPRFQYPKGTIRTRPTRRPFSA